MRHRDQYYGIVDLRKYGKPVSRIESEEQLQYFRDRPQYDEGRDNGYVYTSREHDDEECEEFRPKSYVVYEYKDGKPTGESTQVFIDEEP